jgi:hypothetical protein
LGISGQSVEVPYQAFENKILVNVRTLSPGIYFMQIMENGTTIAVEKICIEK